MSKKMIFHHPSELGIPVSATPVRIRNIIKAFENIGYEVDLVLGYAKKRKEQIAKIKQNILNGTKYDFLYSENSTMPTPLTEPHHFPSHLMLDYSFFKFCKRHNIPIGLFYLDIHWKFPEVSTAAKWKEWYKLPFYYFDLWQTKKYVDIMYVPHHNMAKHFPSVFNCTIDALPPGTIMHPPIDKTITSPLKLLYIGGMGNLYGIDKLLSVSTSLKNLHLTICSRSAELERSKFNHITLPNKQITFINNLSSDQLGPLYTQADIASLFLSPIVYLNLTIPFKFFEYISYEKPILATKGTCVGDFVTENNIGWTIPYEEKELIDLLSHLQQNPNEIHEKVANIRKIKPLHTWEQRAQKVASDLKNRFNENIDSSHNITTG